MYVFTQVQISYIKIKVFIWKWIAPASAYAEPLPS